MTHKLRTYAQRRAESLVDLSRPTRAIQLLLVSRSRVGREPDPLYVFPVFISYFTRGFERHVPSPASSHLLSDKHPIFFRNLQSFQIHPSSEPNPCARFPPLTSCVDQPIQGTGNFDRSRPAACVSPAWVSVCYSGSTAWPERIAYRCQASLQDALPLPVSDPRALVFPNAHSLPML